jgi:excinuclease UvrABC nuclease subunit
MLVQGYNSWDVADVHELIEKLNAEQWVLDEYKEEYAEFCKESKELNEDVDFCDFVDNIDDEFGMMEVLAKRYAKEEKVKGAIVEVIYKDSGDYYIVAVQQVIPESIEDFKELMELYLEKNDSSSMTEVVMDKIERVLGGEK